MSSDSSSVAFLTVLVGIVISAVLTILTGWTYFLQPVGLVVIAIFAAVGILQYGASRRTFYYAIRNLGANITAPIIMMTMMVGADILALVFLRERITGSMLFGIALVLVGGFLLEGHRAAGLRGGATGKGYIAAVAAGIGPAFAAVMISYGLSIFPHIIASVFISYTAASIYYLVSMRPESITSLVRVTPRKSMIAFLIAGVTAVGAQLFRAGALGTAPVVLVIPFLTASNLFIPLLTWALAKDVELFNPRTLLGIVIITIGLIFVAI